MFMNRAEMETPASVASPAMGLNDNLNFLGKELHVQTENIQSSAPCILTQVFLRGRVIHTAKYEYGNGTQNPRNLAEIRDLMQKQHDKVIERIHERQANYHKRT
jgi:hypothetical protein